MSDIEKVIAIFKNYVVENHKLLSNPQTATAELAAEQQALCMLLKAMLPYEKIDKDTKKVDRN